MDLQDYSVKGSRRVQRKGRRKVRLQDHNENRIVPEKRFVSLSNSLSLQLSNQSLQDRQFEEWKRHRSSYLNEFLRSDGRRGCTECYKCGKEFRGDPTRCSDCFGWPMLCMKCCFHVHRRLPFHRVEVRGYHIFVLRRLTRYSSLRNGMENFSRLSHSNQSA